AYLIRRLLENTSNESFLKLSFNVGESVDRLLADPAVARPASPPLPDPVRIDPEEDDGMQTPFQSEPITDFSRSTAREQMQAALTGVRARLGGACPLVVSGRRIETAGMIDSVNPSRFSEIVGRICLADTSHLQHAVQAASDAFPAWSRLRARERGDYLRRVAGILRERRFELAAWIILEVGKPWREAD